MPQAIATIIHPEDTEPGEGATTVKRYNCINYVFDACVFDAFQGLLVAYSPKYNVKDVIVTCLWQSLTFCKTGF